MNILGSQRLFRRSKITLLNINIVLSIKTEDYIARLKQNRFNLYLDFELK